MRKERLSYVILSFEVLVIIFLHSTKSPESPESTQIKQDVMSTVKAPAPVDESAIYYQVSQPLLVK